MIFNFTKL